MKKILLSLTSGMLLLNIGTIAQNAANPGTVNPDKKATLQAPLTTGTTPTSPINYSAPHDWCGMGTNIAFMEKQDPTYKARLQKAQQDFAEYMKKHPNPEAEARTNGTSATINLPVIVHIIYNTSIDPNQKISAATVQSQITVLNQDYTRTNTDASNTPAAWTSIAANIGVNFCLAATDPKGNKLANPGCDYVATTRGGFTTDNQAKFTSYGGADQWDPTKYLNIWVCNLTDSSGGVGGYGEFPTSPLSNTFGVVCDYRVFGTGAPYLFGGYQYGRTMTHEFSHCFNLHHIWGDDGGACPGTGGYDDGVADTPPQGNYTMGCPSYPTTDACSTTNPGIMFMNFMDYTFDNCKNVFTAGQKTVVLNAINTYMSPLTTSTVCVTSAPPVADFKASATYIPVGAKINYTDLSTQSPTSWAWTFSGGTPGSSTTKNPTNVQYNAVGQYNASLKATNAYGNNTATKTKYITVVSGNACDTSSNLPANAYLTLYGTGTGYVTGCYGDTIQKVAEYFATYPAPAFKLTGVYIYFAKASSKTAGRTVTVNIYDNTGTSGAPGKVLSTQTVTVSTISTKAPTLVTLPTPITPTTPIYVGVDFTSIAAAYKTDTIAIVSDTNNDGGNPNTAWQYDVAAKYSINGWYAVSGIWNINISHAIWLVMCQAPNEAYQYELNTDVKFYPNPTTGKVNAELSFDEPTDVQVQVYNMLGQIVHETRWNNVTNETYSIDLSNQANGMYFVKLISDKATVTKKILISK